MSSRKTTIFLLTGPPGIGKTTLVQKVSQKLTNSGCKLSGFYTAEVRKNGVRNGFDVVTLNGTTAPLARVQGVKNGPNIGKYIVDIPSFENAVLPLFNVEPDSILVIDEIGKMESLSDQFVEAVKITLKRDDILILATIPIQRRSSISIVDLIRSHPSAFIFTVDVSNRDKLVEEISQDIIKKFKQLNIK